MYKEFQVQVREIWKCMIMDGMKRRERDSFQATLYGCWKATGRHDIRRLAYAHRGQIKERRSIEKAVEGTLCAGNYQAPGVTRIVYSYREKHFR